MWQSFTFAEYIEVIITKLTEKKQLMPLGKHS